MKQLERPQANRVQSHIENGGRENLLPSTAHTVDDLRARNKAARQAMAKDLERCGLSPQAAARVLRLSPEE
jgi:hypothetical protein